MDANDVVVGLDQARRLRLRVAVEGIVEPSVRREHDVRVEPVAAAERVVVLRLPDNHAPQAFNGGHDQRIEAAFA